MAAAGDQNSKSWTGRSRKLPCTLSVSQGLGVSSNHNAAKAQNPTSSGQVWSRQEASQPSYLEPGSPVGITAAAGVGLGHESGLGDELISVAPLTLQGHRALV